MGGLGQSLALVTQLGLTMVISIIIGLAVGLWIDGRLHTSPWGTLLFVVLGTVVGSMAVYQMVKASIKQQVDSRNRPDSGSDQESDKDL